MNFCISWFSRDHPISCIAVHFSFLSGKSPVLSSAVLLVTSCSRIRMLNSWDGEVSLGAATQFLCCLSHPHHCLHSWALLWQVWEGWWLLLIRAKVPHLWLCTCSPESTWKGICPVHALISGNFYNHCKNGKASSAEVVRLGSAEGAA